MLVGAPEDNGLPPLSLETGVEGENRKGGLAGKPSRLSSEEIEGSDQDGEPHTNLDRQVKDCIEELNPKKFQEKAEKRIKDYLGEEMSKQLIKGLHS
jgi:hypothetical protein